MVIFDRYLTGCECIRVVSTVCVDKNIAVVDDKIVLL